MISPVGLLKCLHALHHQYVTTNVYDFLSNSSLWRVALNIEKKCSVCGWKKTLHFEGLNMQDYKQFEHLLTKEELEEHVLSWLREKGSFPHNLV
jgi:hypothetical protein